MFVYSFIKKKEIPDELKTIIQVIETKRKEMEEYEVIEDGNKFLLAEKNCIPHYKYISSSKLVNANDDRVCFYDIEELLKLTPRGVENMLEKKSKFAALVSYFKQVVQWDKIKEIIRIEPADGMSLLSTEEVKQKEIKNISVSALGQNIALVSRHNIILLVRMEAEVGKLYNPKLSNLEEIMFKKGEIVDINWHGVDNTLLYVAYKDRIFQMKTNQDLDLVINKQMEVNKVSRVKCSPSGEFITVLSDEGKSIHLYNFEFKPLYTKSLFFKKYKDIIWAPNSNFFVLYTDNNVYLFNVMNMTFRCWTDFLGKIIEVLVSETSNLILIFTDHEDCPLYVAYNMVEDLYSSAYYDSYGNVSQYYLQTEFKLSYKIYSLSHFENFRICKARLNSLNNRLVVQYTDTTGKLRPQLKIFEIFLSRSVHDIRLNYLFTMNNFRNMTVTDFELYYNYFRRFDTLLTLWDDRFLSLTYLNAYDLSIS